MLPNLFGTTWQTSRAPLGATLVAKGVGPIIVKLCLLASVAGLMGASTPLLTSATPTPVACTREGLGRDPISLLTAVAPAPQLTFAALSRLTTPVAQSAAVPQLVTPAALTQLRAYADALKNHQAATAKTLAGVLAEHEFVSEIQAAFGGGQSVLWGEPARLLPVASAAPRVLSWSAALRADEKNLSPALRQWQQGLAAWQRGEWLAAADNFGQLALQTELAPADRAAAAYWGARAAGQLQDVARADALLQLAAQQGLNFYSLLAANALEQNWPLDWQGQAWLPVYQQVLAAQPAGRHGLFWLQFGDKARAEAALRRLDPRQDSRLLAAVHALALRAGLPRLAMDVATHRRLSAPEKIVAQYPLPPWQPANVAKPELALLFAMMRQESRFDPKALSEQGASGLMQLMPATAAKMQQAQDAASVSDPHHNVLLGLRYVGQLAEVPSVNQNLVLLLAAYNAGPGKAERWWQELPHQQDPLLLLELMPYRETRTYVQEVLLGYWLYRDQLQLPRQPLVRLAAAPWPLTGPQLASAR